jgi:DNA repair protein RecO (recombination protein O)
VKSYSSQIIFDKLKLDCVKSLFSIIDELFLEREEQPILFERLNFFLQKITDENYQVKNFLADYIKLELKILKVLGYGIDLSSCAVTDSKVDLVFVSPKSARAVSVSAAKGYEKKLLKLPEFLIEESANYDEQHLLEALELSGFFLKKFLFEERSFGKEEKFFYRENIKKFLIAT